MKNDETRILVLLKVRALFISPPESAQSALVIPQTGHSTPNSLSIKQKCGIKFRKSITVFLKKIKTEIMRMLLSSILISF
jgi:hypothetical protein